MANKALSQAFAFQRRDSRTMSGLLDNHSITSGVEMVERSSKYNERSSKYDKESNYSRTLKLPITTNGNYSASDDHGSVSSAPLSFPNAMKHIILDYWNILLVFVPAGVMAGMGGWEPGITFWLNFLALVPLAKLLGMATEELAVHLGENVGGLLNATFGNAVEMILTIELILNNEFSVVKQTLIGSILSNLLLVLGCAFFLGGLIFKEQSFNAQGANVNTSLLILAMFGVLVPTAIALGEEKEKFELEDSLVVSRLVALVLFTIYGLFLIFQLKTHQDLFSSEGDDDEEEAMLSVSFATVVLGLTTVQVAINSQMLVDAIEPMVTSWHFPKGFIGIILLPIVGNACEHATAISMAIKNKVDLSIGIAIGSSTQIAICVIPFSVLAGLFLNKGMNLIFAPVEALIIFLSVVMVANVTVGGKSNWLSGVILLACYVVISIVFWYV